MYYLWIDPGIRKLWYAIIDENKNIIDAGALIDELKDVNLRKWNIRRLKNIVDFFVELLEKYEIESLCIEKLYFTKYNQSNAEYIYGVRWALIYLLTKKWVKIKELGPTEIKKYITGNGTAGKIMMQTAIKRLFWLKNLPEPHDIADALWMAWIALVSNKR